MKIFFTKTLEDGPLKERATTCTMIKLFLVLARFKSESHALKTEKLVKNTQSVDQIEI